MNTLSLLRRVGLVAALTVASVASAAVFVRPGLSYFDYQTAGADGGVGPSLAVGATFGANDEHEIGLDVARAPWKSTYDSGGLLSSLNQTIDGHVMPVLASYRFNFGAPASRLRFFVGASAGSTKWSGTDHSVISTNTSSSVYSGGPEQWTTTWGGTAGAALQVSDNVRFELGYRYLAIKGVDYRVDFVSGTGAGSLARQVGDLKTHVITAALGFRF